MVERSCPGSPSQEIDEASNTTTMGRGLRRLKPKRAHLERWFGGGMSLLALVTVTIESSRNVSEYPIVGKR